MERESDTYHPTLNIHSCPVIENRGGSGRTITLPVI